MKPKLIREIPPKKGLPYYFKEYELECIDCGEHFFRRRYSDRTIPYCAECWRKHEAVKQRERNVRKAQKATNDVLDCIKDEIESMSTSYCGGYIGLDKQEVLQVIERHKEVSK